jgi:predicted nucleotidyltransferase
MEPSFEKLLVLLAEAGVRFIVVGGVAVTLQGYVRLTEDVDLLLDSAPENISNLLKTLSDYGEGFARELSTEDFTEEEGAVRIVEEVEQCQIDLFTLMSGLRYSDVIHAADRHLIGKYAIPYASKAHHFDAMALRQLSANPRAFD